MPESFLKPDEFNVVGGVEFGFLSTTTNRDVAMHYAAGQSSAGKPAIVLQMEQGMIDRGADLGWLSQYPHEAEASAAHFAHPSKRCRRLIFRLAPFRLRLQVCFPPLTGLGVECTRVDGSVLVVNVRLSVNLGQPIERVVAKMQAR